MQPVQQRYKMATPFFTSPIVFSSAVLLRIVLLFYGLIQDKYSALPYTDIDYFVFTDAARYVSRGLSPYERETYRYTPLLAWILLPTARPGAAWFSFGKLLFALADIVSGWLIVLVLRSPAGGSMRTERALKFASIWLLNPMVATISTRGSSEGLLGVMVVALLWAVLSERITLAGVLLGLAVHFKIYPFIYGVSILWYLESHVPSMPGKVSSRLERKSSASVVQSLLAFFTPSRIILLASSLTTFMALNMFMYTIYSMPFLTHTYLHHLTRIDHRHNFSPYNTLLHLSSAIPSATSPIKFESFAFIPQLALSAVLIPLTLAKDDLAGTMLAQTFAFVAFNKVCTSQVRRQRLPLVIHYYFIQYPAPHVLSSLKKNSDPGYLSNIFYIGSKSFTYGHRLLKTRLPVRSAKDKHQIGKLVVGSVTTSES